MFWVFFLSIFAFIFIHFSEIDLWVSRQFYHDGAFVGCSWFFSKLIKNVVPWFTPLSLLGIVWGFFRSPIQAVYLCLCLALGPGIVINLILKPVVGRARPYNIEAFGGNHKFTPAFVFSKAQGKSCVSGDPSIPFSLVSLGYVYPPQRRRWFIIAWSLGSIIGFYRLCVGAHFLSDVLFSGLIMGLVAWGLSKILLRRR